MLTTERSETASNSAAVDTVAVVRCAIDEIFESLDAWCATSGERLLQRPSCPDAWTVAEHLEHVSLVNHFLLLTITRGVKTALRRAETRPLPAGGSELSRLAPIADPAAFVWEPPGHMIPTGMKTVTDVRKLLADQHMRSLELLGSMANGEGRFCSIQMSVHSLGKLDMYQWFYFLAQHGRWHLEFLKRREPPE